LQRQAFELERIALEYPARTIRVLSLVALDEIESLLAQPIQNRFRRRAMFIERFVTTVHRQPLEAMEPTAILQGLKAREFLARQIDDESMDGIGRQLERIDQITDSHRLQRQGLLELQTRKQRLQPRCRVKTTGVGQIVTMEAHLAGLEPPRRAVRTSTRSSP
jgi:hypothetical protein